MKDFLSLFKRKIIETDIKYYFSIIFILQLIPNLILTFFGVDSTNESVIAIEQSGNKIFTFLITVIWGPLFETVIYQFLPINMIKTFTSNLKYSMYLSIGISSLLFGFSHTYNLYYFLFATCFGFILAATYYVSQFFRKENGFIIILLLHSLNNFLAFLIN